MQVLYDEGAVSKQQFDAAKLQYTVAKTQYESAKIAAPGNLEAAGAQLKQAQAGLELARSQLENTVIKSPVSGMVASKSVNVGEMAAPGYPVFTIVNIDKVYADLDISEVNIGSVEKGRKCLLLFLLQTKRSLAVLLLMSALSRSAIQNFPCQG